MFDNNEEDIIMTDIQQWMEKYKTKVNECFKDRVLFIGLQGSYARQEAKETSDIDVVLILDKVEPIDLIAYRKIISSLDDSQLICGFVSGAKEIYNWSKSDLFQFCFDTIAFQGKLENLVPIIDKEDIRLAVLNGACDLYHLCSHNFVHAMDIEILKAIFKPAFFVLQAKNYYENNLYIRNKTELNNYITNEDKSMVESILMAEKIDKFSFERYSNIMLIWTSNIICKYGAKDSTDEQTKQLI